MAGTTYYEEKLYRPRNKDGRADKESSPITLDIAVSNFYGDNHQIFLRTTDVNGNETTLHLTKEQACDIAEALENAAVSIGYDNQ